MYKLLIYCLIALLAAACTAATEDVRPVLPDTTYEPTDTLLQGTEPRFISSQLSLRLSDGGIAFEQLGDGSYRGIDLQTGDNFEFIPDTTSPILRINGARVGYTSVTAICDGDLIHYRLTAEPDTIYLTLTADYSTYAF